MSQNTVVTWSLQLQCLVAQGWVMVHLDQQGCTGVGHVPLLVVPFQPKLVPGVFGIWYF